MGEVVQLPTYGERLKRAASYERETKELHDGALKERNRLIVEAVDNGYPQNRAASDCTLSAPTITRILATPARWTGAPLAA